MSTSAADAGPAPAVRPSSAAPRVDSVDVLRGVVMVVMALDHVRDFFHWGSLHGADPLDLNTTTPWLFFTRWITHFCAPTFMFLAGTGAYLASRRGKTKRELSQFLVTRGIWLIFLELTYFNWAGWSFTIDLHNNWALVIWALGWSMIVLAALVHLPTWAIATFGLVMILGHNALDGIQPAAWGSQAWLWNILHVPGTIKIGTSFNLWVLYPLIPWVGVMAAGYAFGTVYTWEASVRRDWLWRAGTAAIAGFILLRFTNAYGNLTPWTPQPRPGFALLSFLDVTKYPPSLCYLLMTLGPGLLLLAVLERPLPRVLQPFLVFGRVPFFYYALHVPLIHGLAVILSEIRFGTTGFSFAPDTPPQPATAGVSLPLVYLIWIAVVVALYPACKWFAALKRGRRDAWLSYL
jgi:uncharacterized membrane protein